MVMGIAYSRSAFSALVAAGALLVAVHATADIDRDCLGELVVGRRASANDTRLFVYDDGDHELAPISVSESIYSEAWHGRRYVSALEFGDVEGDGYDELVVGTTCSDYCNPGYPVTIWKWDPAASDFREAWWYGGWSNLVGPGDFAFGNVDGDPGEELAIPGFIDSSSTSILTVWNLAWDQDWYAVRNSFAEGGPNDGWGEGAYVTAVAFGDVDEDGLDELVVARNPGDVDEPGVETWWLRMYKWTAPWDQGGVPQPVWSYGTETDTVVPQSVSLGNVDDEGGDDLAVGVVGPDGIDKLYIFRFSWNLSTGQFDHEIPFRTGSDWEGVSAVALGDLDRRNGTDELAVGRGAQRGEWRAGVFRWDGSGGPPALVWTAVDDAGDSSWVDSMSIGETYSNPADTISSGELAASRSAGSTDHQKFYVWTFDWDTPGHPTVEAQDLTNGNGGKSWGGEYAPQAIALGEPSSACIQDWCNGVDDNGNGVVDENCLFKFLFIPFCWTGDPQAPEDAQRLFEEEADRQLDFLLESVGMDRCAGNVARDYVDISLVHLGWTAGYPCDGSGTYGPQMRLRDAYAQASADVGAPSLTDYTVAVALTDTQTVAGTGVGGMRLADDFVWVTDWPSGRRTPSPDSRLLYQWANLAHEVGHILDLDDEYCHGVYAPHVGAWCALDDSINRLESRLGCEPNPDSGSCCDPSRGFCFGNHSATSAGRCIMGSPAAGSAPNGTIAPVPGWCHNCMRHIKQLAPTSGVDFVELPVALDCASIYAGDLPILDIGAEVDSTGGPSAVTVDFLPYGRRPLTFGARRGEFWITIRDSAGSLVYETGYDLGPVPVDVGDGTPYPRPDPGEFHARVMLPDGVAGDEVMPMEVFDQSGVLTSRVTLHGQPPDANAGADIVAECQDQAGAVVMLNGAPSADPDGDTITYLWTSSSLSIVDPTAATSIAVAPLGTSTAQLVVNDGLFESQADSVSVQVVDTTPPEVLLTPMPQFRRCYSGSQDIIVQLPTVADVCSTSVALTGTVVRSSNPAVALPVPLEGPNAILPIGAHTIRWVATDPSGNSTAIEQLIEVIPSVYTTENLEVRDRAEITNASGALAPIGNAGTQQTYVGVEAHVGDIHSQAPVELRDRAFVAGWVESGATVTPGNDVTITSGIMLEGVPQPVPFADEFDVDFPAEDQGPIHLEPYQSHAPLPGAYGAVELKQGARLSLSSGSYFFRSLMLQPDSMLELTGGAVEVYVEDSVTHRGSVTGSGSLLLGFVGSSTVFLESAFRGWLVAPDAEVVVRGDFTGEIYARRLLVDADETVECAIWAGGEPGGATCNDGEQNGNETDVDCGGPSCAGCSDGGTCQQDQDCVSGLCQGGTCQAPACTDGIQNGDETDVDCGGSCDPCTEGMACSVDADCLSGDCTGNVCQPPGAPFELCSCVPSKCTDCAGPVANCEATQGCVDIVECTYNHPCSFPHENCEDGQSCYSLCGHDQSSQAGQAANGVVSCMGGC